MYRYLKLLVLISVSVFAMFGCGSRSQKIIFNEMVWVEDIDGKIIKKKKGESIEIGTQPLKISSAKRAGSVIIIKPDEQDIRLPFSGGKNLLGPAHQITMSPGELNFLVTEISEIQFLIDNANLKEALVRIRAIRKRHRSVSRLSFLEATTLVLLGEDDTAKSILERSLRKKPRNLKAVKLYQSLGGKIEAKRSR